MNLIIKENTYTKKLSKNLLHGEIVKTQQLTAIVYDEFDLFKQKLVETERQAEEFILKTFSKYRP
jgi:hypothetical protein